MSSPGSRLRRTLCRSPSATRRSLVYRRRPDCMLVCSRVWRFGSSAARNTRPWRPPPPSRCWSARRSEDWPAVTRSVLARWRLARHCWSRELQAWLGWSRQAPSCASFLKAFWLASSAASRCFSPARSCPNFVASPEYTATSGRTVLISSDTCRSPIPCRSVSASPRWLCLCWARSSYRTSQLHCSWWWAASWLHRC